jgi:membrane-associated phospholipid phosphatase
MAISIDPLKPVFPAASLEPFHSPWRWVVPLLALLALLVLLVLGVNVPLFYFMNGVMSHAGDSLWIHLSMLGDGQIMILFVLPFLGRRPDVVWQYIIATILGGVFVHVAKEVFSSVRPPAILPMDSFHLIGPDLQINAFPSGHTTGVFILAGLICLQRVHARYKILVLLVAVLVGLSRVASGVHWPQDVLGGVIAGWLVAVLSVWFSQQWPAAMNIWFQRVFALFVTPFSLWTAWTLWHSYADVYPGTGVVQILLLLVCLGLSVPGQLRLFGLRR